jgi:hypothetical protein
MTTQGIHHNPSGSVIRHVNPKSLHFASERQGPVLKLRNRSAG